MTGIAVTGMHRAGTSMVAHALSRSGLYLGAPSRMLPAAPDNPEGFFEHAAFVRLADDLLEACGGAWDHLPAARPLTADDPRVAALAERAHELVAELGDAPVWGWKDPRTCLTAGFWVDLDPQLKVIVCVRNPLEVAVSLRRRNGMSYLHALSLWRGYYAAVLDAVAPERRLVTHYDAHLADPAAELARLAAFAGLEPSAADVADRSKRHHRLELALADAGTDAAVIELYARLCAEAGYTPVETAPASTVDRRAVELALAQQSLERYGRYVAGLQKDLAEQAGRVADLESSGRGALLDDLVARLDALEDAQHDARYAVEDLSQHPHADDVRAGRSLVRQLVPRREAVLVAGGDAALLDICARPTAPFAITDAPDLAAIARLEAARLEGYGSLLVPGYLRARLDARTGFADHLLGRYPVLADDGQLVVDLRARVNASAGWPSSLPVLVERLAPGVTADPAVLDWSELGIASLLPGRNVFTPPAGALLPYLERSVDLVVVRDAERLDEARRVASRAVVVLARSGRPRVVDVELVEAEPPAPAPAIRYVVAGEPDPTWRRLFAEAVGAPLDVLTPGLEPVDLRAEAEVVALVQPGVLPLPGCAAAATTTLAGTTGAVAVKLLDAQGRIESAGEVVFADGSTAGIAAGAAVLAEPWHEYVRDVCGGRGLLFVGGAALDALGDRIASLEPHPLIWAAAVWRAGLRVRYQPTAAAVRATTGVDDDALAPVVATAWAPALPHRPVRPATFDLTAQRTLLARDDVEGAWR
ncbi:MAG: sulfotransferase [Jatrophihabitans sp.]|uniref:sulfotransferase family protein n=1 Tax=Jatrophihabitans sp. TaxID=1932789 RepID=UPI003F80BA51